MRTIGEVGAVFSSLEGPEATYRAHVMSVSSFMRSHNVPPALQKKVGGYFQHMWQRHAAIDSTTTLLESLPPTLRKEVALFLNRPIIESIPFFTRELLETPGFCQVSSSIFAALDWMSSVIYRCL